MKTIGISIILLISCAFSVMAQEPDSTAGTQSQVRIPSPEEVMFRVALPDQKNISPEAAELLANKVEQILGRCNAGAAGDRDVFVVQPTINIGEENRTEGLVRDISTLSGELVLQARNRYTGANYYSATIPLRVADKNPGGDPALRLAKSIKPSDAAYVRFVRNARKNVSDYAAANPDVLIVPEQEPLLPVLVIINNIITTPSAPTAPTADPEPAVSPAPAPAVPTAAPEIFYSEPGWNVKIDGCRYESSLRSIVIDTTVTATKADHMNRYTGLRKAISANGESYSDFPSEKRFYDFPVGVGVKVKLTIGGVGQNPGKLSFVQFVADDCKVEIRNLTVR